MARTPLFLYTTLLPLLSFGQRNEKPMYPCTQTMKTISYYWRLDSLAGNGYRQVIKDKLLGCYIDKFIKADSVYKWLGKPTSVRKYSDAFIYRYNYYDDNSIPDNVIGPFHGGSDFLEFNFGTDSLLHKTTRGSSCG